MKKLFILCSLLLIVTFNCSDKKQEIEDLIKNKDYDKAQDVLFSLTEEEKNDPKIIEYQTTIDFYYLVDTLNTLSQEKKFNILDSLIEMKIHNFIIYKNLYDSLYVLRKSYAFQGADFYYSQKMTKKAYQNIINYSSVKYLTIPQLKLMNELKIKVISGIWNGKMDIGGKENIVRMKIEPENDSTFGGLVRFDNQRIWSNILDGKFDGKNLSFDYFLGLSIYKSIIRKATGAYNNGILKITFSVIGTEVDVKKYDDGSQYVAIKSNIVSKECSLTKEK